jgi:hypothetical protein
VNRSTFSQIPWLKRSYCGTMFVNMNVLIMAGSVRLKSARAQFAVRKLPGLHPTFTQKIALRRTQRAAEAPTCIDRSQSQTTGQL